MTTLFRAILFAIALCALPAKASVSYQFSYTFGDNSAITGSLSGDQSGQFITNIDHVHVFLNAVEFVGAPLFQAAWNPLTHAFDHAGQATLSANPALNNFVFADAAVPADFNVSNYFYFINDDHGQEVFAVNYNSGDVALDNPANASWSLTAIPEPASLATLLAGLCLMSITLRRRR
ncbi:MAG: PEP-CTERM sorting domain-containing protein [Pseudomonadota bacterium]